MAGSVSRGTAAAAGTLARWREQVHKREQARETAREARTIAAKRRSAEAAQRAAEKTADAGTH